MATNQYCKEPSYFRTRAFELLFSVEQTKLGDLEFLSHCPHSNVISSAKGFTTPVHK